MKTFLEKKYEQAVISRICEYDISPKERAELMLDFHNNSEMYYDNLCDALLAISTHQNIAPIWISPNGNCRSSLRIENPNDRILLYSDEVPDFDFDLVNQLEVAILNI